MLFVLCSQFFVTRRSCIETEGNQCGSDSLSAGLSWVRGPWGLRESMSWRSGKMVVFTSRIILFWVLAGPSAPGSKNNCILPHFLPPHGPVTSSPDKGEHISLLTQLRQHRLLPLVLSFLFIAFSHWMPAVYQAMHWGFIHTINNTHEYLMKVIKMLNLL